MTAPEPVPRTSQRPFALCEGGFRCDCPPGHATAAVRLSSRLAGEDRTRLLLLCDGCTDAARGAGEGEYTARRL